MYRENESAPFDTTKYIICGFQDVIGVINLVPECV